MASRARDIWGGYIYIYILAVLLILSIRSLGLIVSNYSDTLQQAMLVMWFIVVCLILLSGLFTPVRSMPLWAQRLTLLNPCRWFIDGVRTVFVRGGGFQSIFLQVFVLSLFAILMGGWAVVSYRKRT